MKNHWLNKENNFEYIQASAYCWDTEYTIFYNMNCGTSIIPDNIGLAEDGLTVFETDKVTPETKPEENSLEFSSQTICDRGDLGFDIYSRWSMGNYNNRQMLTYFNDEEGKQLFKWLLKKYGE
jgi:hypothetical protein